MPNLPSSLSGSTPPVAQPGMSPASRALFFRDPSEHVFFQGESAQVTPAHVAPETPPRKVRNPEDFVDLGHLAPGFIDPGPPTRVVELTRQSCPPRPTASVYISTTREQLAMNRVRPKLADIPVDVEAAGLAILWPLIDPIAYGWQLNNGDRPQVSGRRIDDHYLAVWEHQFGLPLTGTFFPKQLKATRILMANRGAEQLRVRTRFDSNLMLVRTDVDAHNPHQDDLPAAKAWADAIFGGLPYWNLSERGASGFLLVDCAGMRLDERNHLRERLDVGMGALARAAGLKCGVEVCGGHLLTSQPYDTHGIPDGARHVVGGMHGKFLANLPNWRSVEDVVKLRSATLRADDPIILQIIRDGEAVAAEQQAAIERSKKAVAAILSGEADRDDDAEGSPKPGTRTPPSPETAGKPEIAFWAVVEARLRLGIRTIDEVSSHEEEIIELAHEIYDSCGFSTNKRDRGREARIRGAFKLMADTFDDKKAGNGGDDPLWFTTRADGRGNDVDAFHNHAIGTGITSRLAEANKWLAANHHPKITDDCFDIVAVTVAKNAEKHVDGASPVTALLGRKLPGGKRSKGMLRNFGISADGSTVRLAMKIIEGVGIIGVIREASKGICRAYKVLKRGFFHFLPVADPQGPSAQSPGPAANKGQGLSASSFFTPEFSESPSVSDDDLNMIEVENAPDDPNFDDFCECGGEND